LGTHASSINNTARLDTTKILLEVALNTQKSKSSLISHYTKYAIEKPAFNIMVTLISY
jgi:hypothetical protein